MLVRKLCKRRRLRDVSPTLRASALLALCKLMCLDAHFCNTNLQLLFTLLQNRCIKEDSLRFTRFHALLLCHVRITGHAYTLSLGCALI